MVAATYSLSKIWRNKVKMENSVCLYLIALPSYFQESLFLCSPRQTTPDELHRGWFGRTHREGLTVATFTNQGLPNNGVTSAGHYNVAYDTSFSGADGLDLAANLMAICESDFALMSKWFGNISLPLGAPIVVQIANSTGGGATTYAVDVPLIGSNTVTVTTKLGALKPGGTSVVYLRFLLIAEVTEIFMLMQSNGWRQGYQNNEGSCGEGLSRFLAQQFLLINQFSLGSGGALLFSGLETSHLWLNSPRNDYVNHVSRTDNAPDPLTGCALLFIYYLNAQLGFGIEEIVANGASELSGVYTNLTDDFADPFPFFLKLMNAVFPPTWPNGPAISIPGSNPENPFPIVQQMHITCIDKPSRTSTTDHILSVGGFNKTLQEHFNVTQPDCMTLISGGIVNPGQYCRQGNYKFFVEGGGSTADVGVFEHAVPGPDGQRITSYIATVPDRTKADNLLSLPQC